MADKITTERRGTPVRFPVPRICRWESNRCTPRHPLVSGTKLANVRTVGIL